MKIALMSVSSSSHHIAKKFEKESTVEKIFHYGANKNLPPTEKYEPIPVDISYSSIDDNVSDLIDDLIDKNVDLVLTSHVSVSRNPLIHEKLKKNNIAYFFPESNLVSIEFDRLRTKKFLDSLNIPFSPGKSISGEELFKNYFNYQRPFVIKLNCHMHGKQTIVVDDENYKDVYYDLFSIFIDYKPKITNIGLDGNHVLEEYLKLKAEYSFISMVNSKQWQYFGSAKDYKKAFDGDRGYNTDGLGSINLEDIDPRVFDYMDRIFCKLQSYLKAEKNQHYKGFIYLGIGITENDLPVILEINTRAGEPEIDSIIETVDNNLSEVLFSAATDQSIPGIVRNKDKISVVKLVNKNYDWSLPIFYFPKLNIDNSQDVDIYFDGNHKIGIYHSMIIAKADSHPVASNKIYRYLEQQDLRGFYYRKDIGLV